MLGWSIDDLSAASGVTPLAIKRLEQGAYLKAVNMHWRLRLRLKG